MQILNTQVALNINIETKEELIALTNKLINYNLFNYLITENKVSIGNRENLAVSTLSSGYTITIYSKSFIVVKLLEELGINYV